MKFRELAVAFDTIEVEASRLKMTQLLADVLQQATPTEAEIICNLSLGQLRPPYHGTKFNVAEKSLYDVVAHMLDISKQTVLNHMKQLGDLGLVIAQYEWPVADELTVTQVYKELCDIEQVSGTGAQERKAALIQELLMQLDPVSAKYVVRIIIQKLRLGFSDMTIVDALSWMVADDKSLRGIIEDAYNVCADIGWIAKRIKKDGIEDIKDLQPQVGIPIRPASAERLPTAKAIIEKIGDCIAQPKLDGFRIQIHVDKTHKKPEIWFFSRNLLDMSDMFPDLIDAFESLPVKQLICEGEAIAYDEQTQTFLPFQQTVKRKRKHGIQEAMQEYPLTTILFDVLYIDGQNVMGDTHKKRRKILLELGSHITSNRISVIEEKKITSAQELEDYFHKNIAAGLEGLVVKKPDSKYQPGKRNFNWIKLKRQESGSLDDTIDCVILGYYFGQGKRAQFGIGAFLVGVYNKQHDVFQTVAKVGTGLKDDEWVELKKMLDDIAVSTKPTLVDCAKELAPDVWVSPELVCVIRADEITWSPVHTAGKTEKKLGMALRFPRFMGYRPDKSAEQSTSVAELSSMQKQQVTR